MLLNFIENYYVANYFQSHRIAKILKFISIFVNNTILIYIRQTHKAIISKATDSSGITYKFVAQCRDKFI